MKKLREAFSLREDLTARIPREVFIEVVEGVHSGKPPDKVLVQGATFCMIDTSALYAVQVGISREEFLAYAAESFDLQAYLHEDSEGNPALVRARMQQLKSSRSSVGNGETETPAPADS